MAGSEYSFAQSAICNCNDLHQAWCIRSTSSADAPVLPRYGLIVWFITATKPMMSRSGTNDVDCTPSVWFFFAVVCLRDLHLIIQPVLVVWAEAGVDDPLFKSTVAAVQIFGQRLPVKRLGVPGQMRN